MSDLWAGLIVLGILSAWLIAALICKGGADQDKREREALKKAAGKIAFLLLAAVLTGIGDIIVHAVAK